MQEFDPVIEASNNLERKKAWMVLCISVSCFIMGILLLKYLGKLDLNIEHFLKYGRRSFFEYVFNTGFIGMMISVVSLGFISWSIFVIIKYLPSGLVPTLESKNDIMKIEKELDESKNYLDTLAKEKIKKRGDITKDPKADDDEEEHLSFRKRTNI